MTTYNKTTLKTFFETGDVPSGQNFADLIDSYVNIVETGTQSMAGALQATEFIAGRVSAGNANLTGSLTVTGTMSAANAFFNGAISVTGDVSANTGTVFASANRWSSGIVSAAGTAQGTAAALIYTVNFGAGVADGVTTGFLLPANQRGRVQYLTNGGASANLWPPTGGAINVLASNAAFGMAANTLYTIVHTLASGYAVK